MSRDNTHEFVMQYRFNGEVVMEDTVQHKRAREAFSQYIRVLDSLDKEAKP